MELFMNTKFADHKFDVLQRYRLIEIIALWEGKLNTSHLIECFGIGRQQASKDINEYIDKVADNNLVYNKSLKGYVPSDDFMPKVTKGCLEEYLQLISRKDELINTFENIRFGFDDVIRVAAPILRVKPSIVRHIISACRNNERIEVDYRSVSAPNKEGRIIAPHSMVHAGNRWHVRAFCEKNQDFRDFVLTRFYDIPETLGKTKSTKEQDIKWNTLVNVCFCPDPRLSLEQQEIVANDYGMQEKRLLLQVKAALVPYLLQLMRVDLHTVAADPKAQQVIISNLDDIKQWLFH